MGKQWFQQSIDFGDDLCVCVKGEAKKEQDALEIYHVDDREDEYEYDDEIGHPPELSLSQSGASFLCVVYARIAQNASHLYSWSGVSVASMSDSLMGDDYLYDTARHLLKNLGDDLDYLASLIEGYRRAERWAELVVNDRAKQATDEGDDARIYLEYSGYRHMSSYVMDWVQDANAEFREDVKLFPTMVELICHEAERRLNTLRIQAGLPVFM